MTVASPIPENFYGVLQCTVNGSEVDTAVEQVSDLGYAVLDSGYNAEKLKALSVEFDNLHAAYLERFGVDQLRAIDEQNTIRAPLAQGSGLFLELAFNENLLATLRKLIAGRFILNQQNGIINPPQKTYNQAAWHRDLPYQHFLSTTPLAINALFCVDDFTLENGATFVLPASHKSATFPSRNYIQRNALQVTAKAGSFILLDCMMFHAGGFNSSGNKRRAVNHLYNIPFLKQQIVIPDHVSRHNLSVEQRQILDFDSPDGHKSIQSYLTFRSARSQHSA
jgi:ectoine hydroxylase-related dioxygenase (phytanoyl-CoA dioxygenase family)